MKGLDPEKTAPFRFDKGPTGCLLIHGFTGFPHVMHGLGITIHSLPSKRRSPRVA